MGPQLTFAAFSDTALIDEVSRLAGAERRATSRLIAALAEFDARRLYLGQGCSSLFVYCTRVLRLSEHEAYGRIEAARVGRRIPTVLEMLEGGELTLTSIGLLAPHLTIDNCRDLLSRAKHRTRREVEEIVASVRPKADSPALVRRLPTAPPAAQRSERQDEETKTVVPDSGAVDAAPLAAPALPPMSGPTLTPLSPERYRIQFTADRETFELLDRAKTLMRHISPAGDLAVVFRRALQSLVKDLEKKRLGATSNPRRSESPPRWGRRIPAAVRREVWKRDGGRCAFVGALGRCEETGFLEFHHVQPFAAGGDSTTANIELRCRAHNQHEADQFFGPLIVRERRPAFGAHSVRTEWESAAPDRTVEWSAPHGAAVNGGEAAQPDQERSGGRIPPQLVQLQRAPAVDELIPDDTLRRSSFRRSTSCSSIAATLSGEWRRNSWQTRSSPRCGPASRSVLNSCIRHGIGHDGPTTS